MKKTPHHLYPTGPGSRVELRDKSEPQDSRRTRRPTESASEETHLRPTGRSGTSYETDDLEVPLPEPTDRRGPTDDPGSYMTPEATASDVGS